MKLTAFTDYSLRVLMYLAAETTRRVTIAEISESFGVSQNHLVKVVHFLATHGWIDTVRGKGGGLLLAAPAAKINVGKVVRDTEGAAVPAECFSEGGGHCVIDGCCRLKGILGEAVQAFYAVLDRYTLADITRNRKMLGKILFIHAA